MISSIEYDLQEWRFEHIEKSYWQDINNQKKLFREVEKSLGFKELDNWYHITENQLHHFKAHKVLEMYSHSLYDALCAVYPEHVWEEWRFTKHSKGFWIDPHKVKMFFDAMSQKMNLKSMDDWYSVKPTHFPPEIDIDSILQKYYGNSLIKALMCSYPGNSCSTIDCRAN